MNLVFAKTRLADVKRDLTVPILELLGVVIGCRISKFVAEQLDIPNINQTLFTDSQCVIEWYKSTKVLKTFVGNRVGEIRNHDIRIAYVKRDENPADIASKGESAKRLMDNVLWWNWLNLPGSEWPSPKYKLTDETRFVISKEEKGSKVLY